MVFSKGMYKRRLCGDGGAGALLKHAPSLALGYQDMTKTISPVVGKKKVVEYCWQLILDNLLYIARNNWYEKTCNGSGNCNRHRAHSKA